MKVEETRLMDHVEENVLALYVLNALEVHDRRDAILSHLKECAGCTLLHDDIREYYAAVGELQKTDTSAILPVLEKSEHIVRRPDEAGKNWLMRLRPAPLREFVTSIRTYPVRWSGAFVVVVAGVLLLMPRLVRRDTTPVYARAKDEFVIALNKEGEELWRSYVGPEYEKHANGGVGTPRLLDVDGDGGQEILVMSPPTKPNGWIDCLNPDGKKRWRFTFKPKMDFAAETFSNDFILESYFTVRTTDQNGRYNVAFTATHFTWWPCVVGLLDARDGKLLGEYWHPGWLQIMVKDISGHRNDQIVAAGYNNAFKKNVFAVLDPRYVGGHGPATPEYTPRGIEAAAEKFYVLLPDPDLFALALRLPPEVGAGAVMIESSSLEVRTSRSIPFRDSGERVAVVFFDFDEHLNCIKVRGGDELVDLHRSLEKDGKLKKKLDSSYFEELRRGVRYWDGEKFVEGTTINKRYVEEMAQKKQKME
jgi:hypothetical protein